MGQVGRKIGGVESRMMGLYVSYLSAFLWSRVFMEERHIYESNFSAQKMFI